MRIFTENGCRSASAVVLAFGICSIFYKNRTNSKRLCRRPDHTAQRDVCRRYRNGQSNKRFCDCVLWGDPEGSPDVFGKGLGVGYGWVFWGGAGCFRNDSEGSDVFGRGGCWVFSVGQAPGRTSEGLGRTLRKNLGRTSLRKNYLWQIPRRATGEPLLRVVSWKQGEMSRNVLRCARRRWEARRCYQSFFLLTVATNSLR